MSFGGEGSYLKTSNRDVIFGWHKSKHLAGGGDYRVGGNSVDEACLGLLAFVRKPLARSDAPGGGMSGGTGMITIRWDPSRAL